MPKNALTGQNGYLKYIGNMNNNEHLVLVGRGPCEQEMRKLQTEKVHIIGYNSNVNSYLKESDVNKKKNIVCATTVFFMYIKRFME